MCKYLPRSNVFVGVLGGTSILIVVGVALDTVAQIETHLLTRNYEGFMRRGRVKTKRGA